MPLLVSKKPSTARVGRPREFDEELVLAGVAKTFWRHGYHATSIDALCEATGLLRGSLYGAYRDKKGILMAALGRYSEGRIARLTKSLKNNRPSQRVIREAMLYYIQTTTDLDRMRACLITNTALEMTSHDPEVARLIERIFRRMAALWAEAAGRAREDGSFDLKLDAKTAGNYLFCVAQGLQVLSKIYDQQELTAIVEMTLRALSKPV